MILTQISCLTEYALPIQAYADAELTTPIAAVLEVENSSSKTQFIAPFDIGAVYVNGAKALAVTIDGKSVVFKTAPKGVVTLLGKNILTFFSTIEEVKKFYVTGYGWLVVHDVTENEDLKVELSLDGLNFTKNVPLNGLTEVYCKNVPYTDTEIYNLVTNCLIGLYIPENAFITLTAAGTTLTNLNTAEGIEYYESYL